MVGFQWVPLLGSYQKNRDTDYRVKAPMVN